MGKVYVYNSGSFSEESQTGESELKIGLFYTIKMLANM